MRGWTRSHLPELLLIAGACLLAATVYALVRHGESRSAGSESTPQAPATRPPPPTQRQPQPATLAIQDVSVSAGPFSATVGWRTSLPARSFLAYGVESLGPTLWTSPTVGTQHSATIEGLAPATSMHLWITASRTESQRAGWQGDVQAATVTDSPSASVSGGAIRLDGHPFFPLMEWGQCSQFFSTALQVGIDLFMSNSCGTVDDMLTALAGRALVAVPAAQASMPAAGVIGWYYPDEADMQGGNPAPPPGPTPGRVSFLTLSNHVWSGAVPPPRGRSVYARLAARADVLGLDLYPLQGFCRTDMLGTVYDVQRQLLDLARGGPTYQWIEDGTMNCPSPPQLLPTPATVRAETWLAIAGGARGVGFFPGGWPAVMQNGISHVTSEIRALAPALLASERPAFAQPQNALRVTAHVLDGALYVVAVNASWSPVKARLTVPAAGGRSLGVLAEGRTLTARNGVIRDRFGPLAVHVYLAAPSWVQ
jgi:hypothetical protein